MIRILVLTPTAVLTIVIAVSLTPLTRVSADSCQCYCGCNDIVSMWIATTVLCPGQKCYKTYCDSGYYSGPCCAQAWGQDYSCVGWFCAACALPKGESPSAVVTPKVVPYTVTLQDYSLNRDGSEVPMFKMTVAIRADGSRAIEAVETGGGLWERILNFSSGRQAYILENKRQKTVTLAARGSSAWLVDADNNCLGPNSADHVGGIEQVEGYRTVKLVRGVLTRWLAVDYGCALVRERVESPDGSKSEKRLVSLTPGEPPTSLFNEPPDYPEAEPSVLFGCPGPNASRALDSR